MILIILAVILIIGVIYFTFITTKIKSCPVCDYPMTQDNIDKERVGYSWTCPRCNKRILNEEI